jgi:hypothetical protein
LRLPNSFHVPDVVDGTHQIEKIPVGRDVSEASQVLLLHFDVLSVAMASRTVLTGFLNPYILALSERSTYIRSLYLTSVSAKFLLVVPHFGTRGPYFFLCFYYRNAQPRILSYCSENHKSIASVRNLSRLYCTQYNTTLHVAVTQERPAIYKFDYKFSPFMETECASCEVRTRL